MKAFNAQPILADELVMNKIYLIRGKKVMLDNGLAELYGIQTKVLKQAVKRNDRRFPADFMFVLTNEETRVLRSQFVTSKRGSGGTRYLPFAFTEQGVAMLSSILNSDRAIDVNIQIIRVFTKMRELLLTHKDILLQLEKMEKKLTGQDADIALIFIYLKKLLNPSHPSRQRIGFRRKNEKE
ncbi:MAG: ORF6N domain-containing protein [Chitinophagaceae bacterium]